MSVEQAYNFKALDSSTSTAGLLSTAQLSELHASGYETVINLLPNDSEHAVADEESIVTGQGVDYIYIPVDFSNPMEQDYTTFVAAIESCQGRRILIHCAANYRVSAFYAMYAYENLGWSAARARSHISSIWNPDDHPPWEEFIATHIPGNDSSKAP